MGTVYGVTVLLSFRQLESAVQIHLTFQQLLGVGRMAGGVGAPFQALTLSVQVGRHPSWSPFFLFKWLKQLTLFQDANPASALGSTEVKLASSLRYGPGRRWPAGRAAVPLCVSRASATAFSSALGSCDLTGGMDSTWISTARGTLNILSNLFFSSVHEARVHEKGSKLKCKNQNQKPEHGSVLLTSEDGSTSTWQYVSKRQRCIFDLAVLL